ncbi:hypothetical protein [Pusillimonas sp.]|uniref:hypothetical protein n=1 Tax=Pusillimonas sp. TaxID=3040095 RepID=UPI0037C6A753
MKRICAGLLFTVCIAGCSPEYNWREVAVGDDVGLVLFPDKPRVETRTLEFSGQQVRFTLTTAEVGGSIFAVGHAPWPQAMQADEQLRRELGHAVISSLYRNLGGEAPAELPAFGESFDVEGSSMQLQARVWLSRQALVEGMVMGPTEDFPSAAAGEFLDSVAKGR